MSHESRLTFVRFSHFKEWKLKKGGTTRKPYDVYKCVCGNETVTRREHIRSGRVKSCGCLKKEVSRKNGLKTKNLIPLKKGSSKIQSLGGKATKGRKSPTKGKIFIKDYPNRRYSTGSFVKPEVADAMFYGVEGEVHSLRQRTKAHNAGKKFKDGKYVA